MADQFEDKPPSGTGRPTAEQIVEARDYLKRHNRKHGIKPTRNELIAGGFELSPSFVARALRAKDPPAALRERRDPAATRTSRRRQKLKKKTKEHQVKAAEAETAIAKPATEEEIKARLAIYIGPPEAMKKNCDIALIENKIRMGLNIILMETMLSKPEHMMVDMRATAALIDALTVSSKLSGGASFEVLPPGEKPELDGDGMKDITPPNRNVEDINDFKRFRLNGNGKAT